jgi:hypothetical protein
MSGCAQNGTVVATPLPPHSLPIILTLARSAAAAGFPCIVVQPFVTLSAPFDPLLSPLPAPDPPLLPRSRWCNASKKSEYWRRLSSLHRMLLWRTLLDRGLNVLGVDAERRLVRNPLPAIAALRTRDEAQYGLGAPPDVLGGAPGWYLKEYYLHTVWLRACDATRALLRRAEARVRGASDQTVRARHFGCPVCCGPLQTRVMPRPLTRRRSSRRSSTGARDPTPAAATRRASPRRRAVLSDIPCLP